MYPRPFASSSNAPILVAAPCSAPASVVHLHVERQAKETPGAAFLRVAARAREVLRGLARDAQAQIVFMVAEDRTGARCELTHSLEVFCTHANRRYSPLGLRFSVLTQPVKRLAN